jgi:hypothetical protein
MDTLTSTLKKTPGLIRMIIVDTTLFPGRIEEIPLDDHTVILAQNGSGKTSMAKLIPVFFGEVMSAVVDTGERDKFIGFYLPRESSYIAFEYRNRHGDIRSVVIHSDPSNTRIQYRFVRDGLRADMFAARDDKGKFSFIRSQSFEGRLRELGTAHSASLLTTTRAFRGIIQGRIDENTDGSDRAGHRQLSDEYGLSSSSAHLTGIEKILTQLLNNNVSMKSLLGVVARQSTDNGEEVFHLLGKGRKETVARWPAQFKAYEKVMALDPQARELSGVKMRIDGAKSEISDRFDTLMAFEAEFEDKILRVQAEIASLKSAGSLQEDAADKAILEMKRSIEDSTVKLSSVRDQIDKITKRGVRLAEAGAENASKAIAGIPALEAELDAARARQDALTSQGDGIIRQFEQARNALREKDVSSRENLRSASDVKIASVEATAEAARISARDLIASTEAEITSEIDASKKTLLNLEDENAKKRQERDDLQPDAEFVERVRSAKTKLDILTDSLASETIEQRRSESLVTEIKHAMELGEHDQSSAERRLGEARTEHKKILDDLEPAAGTLLAFLRRNRPEWGDTIGKVIHPDILQKTGLSPDLTDDEGSNLFGLLLDLDKLDVPEYADKDLLETRREAAGAKLMEAEVSRNEANERQEKMAKEHKDAVKCFDVLSAQLGITTEKQAEAVKTFNLATASCDAHLSEKGTSFSAEIDRISGVITREKEGISVKETHLRDRVSEIRKKLEGDVQKSDADRKEVRTSLEVALQDERSSTAAAMLIIAADEKEALSERGVDADTVAASGEVIKALSSDLIKARSMRSAADEWSAHIDDIAGMPAMNQRLDALKFKAQEDEVKLAKLIEEDKLNREFVKKNIDTAQGDLDQNKNYLASVKAQLASCPAWVTPKVDKGETYSEGHEANLARTMKLMNRLNGDLVTALNLVKKIAATFRHCGDIGISSHLSSEDLGDHSFEWTDTILKWYDGDHQDYRDFLMNGINMAVQPILSAFHDLENAESGVRRVNRKLGVAIQASQGFPHVKDVLISIRTRIKDLPYWNDLQAFEAAHTAWRNDSAVQPSTDLIEALKAFLDHWPEGSDPMVRLDDVIYLEGSITERDNVRKFGKDTDLSNLSSNGNIMVVRQILFTALLNVMRRGSDVRMVWAVDEVASLDFANTESLLKMLSANGISLLTAAPGLEEQVKHLFTHQMRIEDKCLSRIGPDVMPGMREWIADDELSWPQYEDDLDVDDTEDKSEEDA